MLCNGSAFACTAVGGANCGALAVVSSVVGGDVGESTGTGLCALDSGEIGVGNDARNGSIGGDKSDENAE